MVSVFGWPDPNTCMGTLLELRKARKITRLRLVFRAFFLTLATFPRVWIRPSKHGNHKVILYS
jgi:hypothetical protein